jgi:hypothetical protein
MVLLPRFCYKAKPGKQMIIKTQRTDGINGIQILTLQVIKK